MSEEHANTLIAISRCLRNVSPKDLPIVPRAVLIALAGRANNDWIAFPSIETLANDAGTCRSTVRRALDDLCRLGWLRVVSPANARDSARFEIRSTPTPSDGVAERYVRGSAPLPLGEHSATPQERTRGSGEHHQGYLSAPSGVAESTIRGSAPLPEDPKKDPKKDHKEDPRDAREGSELFEDPIPPKDQKPSKRKKGVEVPIPEGWAPTIAHFELGAELGFDDSRVRLEADNFKDRALAKALTYIDWNAAFRTALRNAKKWEKPAGTFKKRVSTGHDFTQEEAGPLDSDNWPEAFLTPPHPAKPEIPPPEVRPPPTPEQEARRQELMKMSPRELERLMNTTGGFHGWGS